MTYEQKRQDARRAKKADEFFARFDKLMMKLGCYVDDESRKIDHFFIESLCEQDLIVGPLEFEYISPKVKCYSRRAGILDIDAMLVSTTTVGILETKSTLRVDDVLKVQNALIPRFRKSFREQQHKDLAVIVAGELILPNAAKLARELGYILLKPGKQGIVADASCYRAA